jgi:pimeloyl-ACP methyl ester carboxylesterase
VLSEPTDAVVITSGVPIAVRDFGGSGRGLVLIHGLGDTLVDWTVMAPMFKKSHHVVALDVRGHGRSGSGAWSWRAAVDDLSAVVDHFGMVDPVVMGHSMGGMIASMWGRQHPGCQGVINLDGHGLPRADQYLELDPDWVRERRAEQELQVREQLAALSGALSPAQVEELTTERRSTGAPEEVLAESVERMLVLRDGATYCRPAPDSAVREIYDSIGDVDMLAIYRDVNCPLLLFNLEEAAEPDEAASTADRWSRGLWTAYRRGQTRDLAELAAAQPNVRFETVPGTHAGLQFERPQQIADTVNDFLGDRPKLQDDAGTD